MVVGFAGSESPTQCGDQTFLNLVSNVENGEVSRWVNSLNPEVGKDSWSLAESIELLNLHRQHGNAWKKMTHTFKSRTDQAIKNHFYSFLRKILRQLSRFVDATYISGVIARTRPKTLSEFVRLPLELSETSKRVLSSLLPNPKLVYDIVEHLASGKPIIPHDKNPQELKSDLQAILNNLLEMQFSN